MTTTKETDRLIPSDKVEGTNVYNRQGEKLGTVSKVMLDKRSGKADYAIMSFGGFLGMGEDHHPLPWDKLDYDTGKGGYVVDLDKQTLEGAPRYSANQEPTFDRTYDQKVHDYYGSPYAY